MTTIAKNIAVLKQEIVNEMFIHTADDNYITARWCYQQKLFVDFLWLSIHCLEKYMKAALLLNGQSSIKSDRGDKYSHNVTKLYAVVRNLAPDLLPDTLTRHPALVNADLWTPQKPEEFLANLYMGGGADTRYLVQGFWAVGDILLKVDMMVFLIRRLCRPLVAKHPEKMIPNKKALAVESQIWRINEHGYLEMTVDGKRDQILRSTFLDANFWFAPSDYKHPAPETYIADRNPILNIPFMYLQGDPKSPLRQAATREVCNWVKENINIGSVKTEFYDACKKVQEAQEQLVKDNKGKGVREGKGFRVNNFRNGQDGQ